jgi:hypothetical protein
VTYRNSKRFKNINIKVLHPSLNHKRLCDVVVRKGLRELGSPRILEEAKIMSLQVKEGWSSGGATILLPFGIFTMRFLICHWLTDINIIPVTNDYYWQLVYAHYR